MVFNAVCKYDKTGYFRNLERLHSDSQYFISKNVHAYVLSLYAAYRKYISIKNESFHYYFILIDQCYHDKWKTTKKKELSELE